MRIFSLTLGPPIIVAVCYWLTMLDGGAIFPPGTHAAEAARAGSSIPPARRTSDLSADCREQAAMVARRIGGDCRIIVRPPFVIAGDFSEEELDRYHRLLVRPIAGALSNAYFDHPPDQPVTILLFSQEQRFREHARRFDQRSVSHEYGYYHRADRRIVVNAATGNGTLAHELTHALAHFDFPRIPAWFDEGLAALHEQSEFSGDRLRLNGLSNWRLGVLLEALRQSRLDSIESLMSRPSIEPAQAAVDYAHARYFCLYLQSRQLLAPFYRKFRLAAETDPTGVETLRELLQADSLEAVDRDFRQWAQNL